jgi:hypothetical protein
MNHTADPPTSVDRPGATVSTVTALLRLIADSVPDICLLHGRDNFTSELWQGDVDLLVVGEVARFFEAVQGSAAAVGYLPVLQIPRLFNTVEVDLVFGRAESWTAVLVNRHGAIINLDVVFVHRRPGLSTEPPMLGVAQVQEDVEAAYLAVKRLRKGERRSAAWRSVADKLEGHESLLQKYLGDTLAVELTTLLSQGDVPAVSMIRRARIASHVRRVASCHTPRRVVRGALAGARRLAHPPGPFVALAGVDGSGKSTVARGLTNWSPFRQVRHLHSRPGLLKPPGWFLGRTPGTGGDPHQPEPFSELISAIRILYFWVDFVLGYYIRVWPVRLRGGFVVSERWWWDLYIDPQRHRLSPLPRLVLALGRLVPRADLFFVLDAPAASILARKRELSAAEIERQRAAWSELSRLVPGLRFVDAAASMPSVSSEVEAALIERQSALLVLPGGSATL